MTREIHALMPAYRRNDERKDLAVEKPDRCIPITVHSDLESGQLLLAREGI
jgi:hypothetical protein